ncbi:hypothetical protein DFJ58DRAFT_840839 [Suillus subalutaceus]|uniref:uncharacterized protein n=1 Tax=Suillus subalutaceus TaxID=48586 RepID=UPI001B85DB51|nr:uncharacterized protein DFJ58DRAFT_840839 [Suillus subalutaceus]KAG1856700.1 hypothetical protein DFJ58DRAFT_840839 [Suillus subalutaceus]
MLRDYLPGFRCAAFQRIAQRTRKLALESMNEPFEYVKRNMGLKAIGNAPKSMVSDLLTEMDEGKEAFPEQAVKQIALTVFVGRANIRLAHATSNDDIFEGYFIPKGTCPEKDTMIRMFSNQKGTLASDGTLLPDTIAAKPMWGFGRRGCPGRFIAEAVMWSAVANLLAAFRITKAKDEAGKEIEVKEEFTSGVVCRPVPFQCSFVLRSTGREKAIRLGD